MSGFPWYGRQVETVTLTQVFTPVRVNSLPCPHCGDKMTVVIPQHQADQLFAPRPGRQPMQVIFAPDTQVKAVTDAGEVWVDCDADFRERFISGMCPACWAEIYGEED